MEGERKPREERGQKGSKKLGREEECGRERRRDRGRESERK